MSFISTVESWFHKQEVSAEKVFTRIWPLVEKAVPIVADLDTVVTGIAASDHVSVLGKVATYLTTLIPGAEKVTGFVAAHQGATRPLILRDAATLLLSLLPGGSVIASDLNLAVELAVSLGKLVPAKN